MAPAALRRLVWRFYREHGRHELPWRKTTDVYRILVSEVMLQQTQVERVVPYYRDFLKRFPTAKKLAAAPLSEVLTAWHGLGYNRRAKMLREAAAVISTTRFDLLKNTPRSNLVARLEELPGVGPYTARAVATFAWNSDEIVIETNIRTVIIHHFFSDRNTTIYRSVSDAQIRDVLARVLPRGKAREWYSALMDYGAHLKRSGMSHTTRHAHHMPQKKFKGSLREARGAIIGALVAGSATSARLSTVLGSDRRADVRTALAALVREQLIEKKKNRYALASGNRE